MLSLEPLHIHLKTFAKMRSEVLRVDKVRVMHRDSVGVFPYVEYIVSHSHPQTRAATITRCSILPFRGWFFCNGKNVFGSAARRQSEGYGQRQCWCCPVGWVYRVPWPSPDEGGNYNKILDIEVSRVILLQRQKCVRKCSASANKWRIGAETVLVLSRMLRLSCPIAIPRRGQQL